MTGQSQFQTLFAYHWATIEHLMDHAGQLSEADYKDHPGYGHGSIHDLLVHILRTDQGWRLALETGKQVPSSRPEEFPDLLTVRAGYKNESKAWQTMLEKWDSQSVESDITLISWRGDAITFPLWHVLQHLVLHGMQHQTELAQLLTSKGQSPGDIDFIFFAG